ncbi:MAG: hypothetical protein ACPGVN_04055 [Alphaproteobacteria bacterium]
MISKLEQRDLAAVIDIGSNSIRLVISDLNDLRPGQHLLNEKVMCQLGFGLNSNDVLDPERRALAISTLSWFAQMCEAANCTKILIFATAAIRQAEDGPAFVQEVEEKFGQEVRVLSGEEEARTAALGIKASIHGACGLVADLGGGSLEIAKIKKDGRVDHAMSMPFGTLILQARVQELEFKEAAKSITSLLRSNLAEESWLEATNLYLIGGTWRALALEHIRMSKYPLRVLHRYSLSRSEIKAFCKYIIHLDDKAMSDLVSVAPRRREVFREACAVILSLLKASKAKTVIFSSAGVREGFLHSQLQLKVAGNPEVKAASDLVVGGARFVANTAQNAEGQTNNQTIGEVLFDWSKPLRAYSVRSLDPTKLELAEVRHRASCHLAEFGWSRHPSYKAEETALMILHSNRLPQSHPDRAYLALCLFKRYGGGKMRTISKQFKRLLPKRLRWEACVLGLVIRVAMGISSALPAKLAQTKLMKTGDNSFEIHLPAAWETFPLPNMKRELQTLDLKYDTLVELKFVL